jgi:hypothetical protein
VIASSASAIGSPQGSATGPQPDAHGADSNAEKLLKFTTTGMGELVDEDGTRLSVISLRASNGVKLMETHCEFDSDKLAEQYLEKRLRKAANAIRFGDKLTKNGRLIGKRAQIEDRKPNKPTANAVLWTMGPHFYEIRSDSLMAILEVEMRLTP